MNRKVRFGLAMPKQDNIRDIDTLKQNFNLRCVLQYYYNGKLLVWLKDRNYINYVHKLEAFNAYNYTKLKKFFGTLFDISDDMLNDDVIVFSQNQLERLLKTNTKQVIYLCADCFSLSAKYKNKTYIGINNPKVCFVDLGKKYLSDFNISVSNVQLPDNFLSVTEKCIDEEEITYRKKQTYLISNTMNIKLNKQQVQNSKRIFEEIQEGFKNFKFNSNLKVDKIEQIIHSTEFFGVSMPFNLSLKKERLDSYLKNIFVKEIYNANFYSPVYGDMYGVNNIEKEKINEVIDFLCNSNTVCCRAHAVIGNNLVSKDISGGVSGAFYIIFTSFTNARLFLSTTIRFSFVLWLLFLCAVEEKFYDNELNVVSDLACILKFSPDMIEDWINFVKYSLTGSKNFEFKTAEAKKVFLR